MRNLPIRQMSNVGGDAQAHLRPLVFRKGRARPEVKPV